MKMRYFFYLALSAFLIYGCAKKAEEYKFTNAEQAEGYTTNDLTTSNFKESIDNTVSERLIPNLEECIMSNAQAAWWEGDEEVFGERPADIPSLTDVLNDVLNCYQPRTECDGGSTWGPELFRKPIEYAPCQYCRDDDGNLIDAEGNIVDPYDVFNLVDFPNVSPAEVINIANYLYNLALEAECKSGDLEFTVHRTVANTCSGGPSCGSPLCPCGLASGYRMIVYSIRCRTCSSKGGNTDSM